MTNEQRYVRFCQLFERLVNDIEMEEERVRNRAVSRRMSTIEYYQVMAELEIRKKTIEEVTKSVLQYLRVDMA